MNAVRTDEIEDDQIGNGGVFHCLNTTHHAHDDREDNGACLENDGHGLLSRQSHFDVPSADEQGDGPMKTVVS